MDFLWNVSLKMLNKEILIASLISFSDYLNTNNHFNFKLSIFVGILQVLKFEFLKFRILEILN